MNEKIQLSSLSIGDLYYLNKVAMDKSRALNDKVRGKGFEDITLYWSDQYEYWKNVALKTDKELKRRIDLIDFEN